MEMNIKVLAPENELIKQLIVRYIVLEYNQDGCIQFTCYPNNNHCLGIMLNKQLKSIHNSVYSFTNSRQSAHYITGLYTKPIQFRVKGPYRELCIDFKPLSFHSFGMTEFSSLGFKMNPLSKKSPKLVNQLTTVFTDFQSIEKRLVSQLDALLLENLEEEVNPAFLVLNSGQDHDIASLSQGLYMSQRSLYRFFRNNLNITPYQYQELIRFQNCIKGLKDFQNLNHIAYDNNLVDGSHLNKMFRKFTSMSPSLFRDQVTQVDDLFLRI